MSIPVIDTIKSLGDFPVVHAEDVDVNGARLDAELAKKANTSDIPSVDGKADKTYVDAELAKKANRSEMVTNSNLPDIAIAGFFNSTTNNTTDFYLTANGRKFKKITSISNIYQTDGDMIFVDDTFYYACRSYDESKTLRILTSKNLVNWSENYFTFKKDVYGSNIGYGEKWLIDTDGKIYLVYGQIVSNTPYRDIRPYIVECTNIKNLEFGSARPITLDNSCVIDPMIIKKENEYFLFCKKERNDSNSVYGNIEIWKSSDLINWNVVTHAIPVLSNYLYEGPFVNFQNGRYYLYVDNWGATHFNGIEVCESTDLVNWTVPVRAASEKIMRHGFCRTITDERAMRIINNYALYSECDIPDDNVIYIHAQDEKDNNMYSKLFSIKVKGGDSAGSVSFKIKDVQVNYYDSEFRLDYIKSGSTFSAELYEVSRNQKCIIKDNEVQIRYTVSDSVDKDVTYKLVTVLVRNDKTWTTPCLTILDRPQNGENEFIVHSVNEFVPFDDSEFRKARFSPLPTEILGFAKNNDLISSGTITADIINDKLITFNFNAVTLKKDCPAWSLNWMFTIGEKQVVNEHFCPLVATMSGDPVLVKFRNDGKNFIAELNVGGRELKEGDVIVGTVTIPFEYSMD